MRCGIHVLAGVLVVTRLLENVERTIDCKQIETRAEKGFSCVLL
jgi:hypothetical protein